MLLGTNDITLVGVGLSKDCQSRHQFHGKLCETSIGLARPTTTMNQFIYKLTTRFPRIDSWIRGVSPMIEGIQLHHSMCLSHECVDENVRGWENAELDFIV